MSFWPRLLVPPLPKPPLTVSVFRVQQVQLVILTFHIAQQVIGRHVAALGLLVICPRESIAGPAHSGRPQSHSHECPASAPSLPSLVISVAEESSSTVSLRASPLLRSSRVSLPSPGAISFRLKLEAEKADGWVGPNNPTLWGKPPPGVYLFMSGRPQELPLPTLWLRLVVGTRPGLQ